jgi:hypothetical protein
MTLRGPSLWKILSETVEYNNMTLVVFHVCFMWLCACVCMCLCAGLCERVSKAEFRKVSKIWPGLKPGRKKSWKQFTNGNSSWFVLADTVRVSFGWSWSGVRKQWRSVLETRRCCERGSRHGDGNCNRHGTQRLPLIACYSMTHKLLPPQIVIFFSKLKKFKPKTESKIFGDFKFRSNIQA